MDVASGPAQPLYLIGFEGASSLSPDVPVTFNSTYLDFTKQLHNKLPPNS